MTLRRGHDDADSDLTPTSDPARWERLVREIRTRAAPHLEERRAPPDLLDVVAGWARPTVAAAACFLLVAGVGAILLQNDVEGSASAEPFLAEALLPETLALWVEGAHEPTVTELVAALEELEP